MRLKELLFILLQKLCVRAQCSTCDNSGAGLDCMRRSDADLYVRGNMDTQICPSPHSQHWPLI